MPDDIPKAHLDLIDQLVCVTLAGAITPKGAAKMLQQWGVVEDTESVLSLVTRCYDGKVRDPYRETFETRLRVAEVKAFNNQYLAEQFLKDAPRAYGEHRVLMSPTNDDKRTRASAVQYHLGTVGHSPSQKHQVSADESFKSFVKELYGGKEEDDGV